MAQPGNRPRFTASDGAARRSHTPPQQKPTAPRNVIGDHACHADTQNRIARLEALLLLEGEVRSVRTLRELIYCIANETRKVVATRQTYVLRPRKSNITRFMVDTVSNLTAVDRSAPAIRTLEDIFNTALAAVQDGDETEGSKPSLFEIPVQEETQGAVFPFRHGVIAPLTDNRGTIYAAIVCLSEVTAKPGDLAVIERLQSVYSHAWQALSPRPLRRIPGFFRKLLVAAVVVAGLATMIIQVPLTTLAPAEVVAKSPQIVAAPIDGVVFAMNIDPNTQVSKGDELFRYVDTELASRHAVARENRNVAAARLQTARQGAFGAGAGARDMAVAQAELELAETELLYAATQLNKTVVRAPRAGLAIFDRRSDWQGRPVAVGEKVLEIANPQKVEFRVDLAISDAIVLNPGARVKVFLDSSPLSPREAKLASANYRASLSASEQLVYKLYATEESSHDSQPRIGARGTAQVFGERVSLGFYLFRRPISVLRQYTGW